MDDVVIPGRFNGPPQSANGGYAAGVVARLLGGGAVEVRLRVPPALDRPLGWDGSRLLDGDTVVASGAPDAGPPVPLPVSDPVSVGEAEEASGRFPGHDHHPYPMCFGCGDRRAPGDGLRLFPGPVAGRTVVASPWVPDASLLVGGEIPLEVMWAALDCSGGWAGLPHHEGTYVLGTMRGEVTAPASVGESHVTLGWQSGVDGRKLRCASALTTADGTLLGWSDQTWIRLAG